VPNTTQAREAEKRQLKNRGVSSRAKTFVTKAERLIFSGDLTSAQGAVAESISALDRAAEKGIIHPNNAARRKSRLMKKLNQAQVKAQSVDVAEGAVAEVGEAEEKPKAEKKEKSK